MSQSKIHQILSLMVSRKASDVYLTGGSCPLIKIEGVSRRLNATVLDDDMPFEILKELLTESQIAELKTHNELNTAKVIPGLGNFRISMMMQRTGIGAVIRYIPSTIPSIERLGLPASALKDIISKRRGLILMVGTTGSGKSTTLAAMLDHLNHTKECHILTVEDPIEYVFTADKAVINQREIGTHAINFHTALKNGMRQAPDVIFIGEIRDRETMSAAMAYAQSGHLCLATLHASNSHQTLNRVLSFYPPEAKDAVSNDLASSLTVIISQRLGQPPMTN